MTKLINVNIKQLDPLITPDKIREVRPVSQVAHDVVSKARDEVKALLAGEDKRFLVIAGPCSIHDPEAAVDYAKRLKEIADKVSDKMMVVMRVYFEKPRTTIGWKGLINDPDLDGTCDVSKGLHIARDLLSEINELGMPCGTEVLDPVSPQYVSDFVSWASIGARTTESQTHREMASGLSMPIGYKNSTDGSLDVAVAAMQASQNPHSFIGLNHEGFSSICRTKGNPWGHLILRGGKAAPNYHPESILQAVKALQSKGLTDRIMVDCSHANSGKQHDKQEVVFKNVIDQRLDGNDNILGVMLESNINEGNQPINSDISKLKYGVSVTDECMGWKKTVELLEYAYQQL